MSEFSYIKKGYLQIISKLYGNFVFLSTVASSKTFRKQSSQAPECHADLLLMIPCQQTSYWRICYYIRKKWPYTRDYGNQTIIKLVDRFLFKDFCIQFRV